MSTGEGTPSVVVALSRVMGDVMAVKKGDRVSAPGQNFAFRGVDSVVNAVGPALRKHGVVAVPEHVGAQFEHYNTAKGAAMKSTVLTIRWRFYGPAGDSIEAETMGEASDAGDKSLSKAHSVAYRTLLLQALCIPTDEPDPDTEVHQRAEPERLAGMDERQGIIAAIEALDEDKKDALRVKWAVDRLPRPELLTDRQAARAQDLLVMVGGTS